jgi:hypothetical protein
VGGYAALVIVGFKPQLFYVGSGNLFQPYALPDTALGGIKDTAPVKGLLPSWLASLVSGILDFKKKPIVPLLKIIRNIHMERQVTSLMEDDRVAVYRNLRLIIHGPEVQNSAHTGGNRTGEGRKGSLIPEIFARKELTVHAGESAFRGKRHKNLSVKFKGWRSLLRDCIIPITIQGEKRVSPKLGTGIFGQHVIMVKSLAPDGSKRGEPVIFVRADDAFESVF